MHVIAHYRIADPAAFRARAAAPMPGRPPHWRLIASAPTRDGAACYELWWAESARALERLLAAAVRPAGSVECHEVDEEGALGLARDDVFLVEVRSRGGIANREVQSSPAAAPSCRHDPRSTL